MTHEEFLTFVGPAALQIERDRGYPAEALLTQVHLESGGLSAYPEGSNNVLGIKWAGIGEYVEAPTIEYENGVPVEVMAKWQVFDSVYDCLTHWADLMDKPWYAQAQPYKSNWAAFLGLIWYDGEKTVYATNPHYQWLAIKRACDVGIPAWCANQRAMHKPVSIRAGSGAVMADGWLEDGKTVVPLRALAEAMGLTIEYDPAGPIAYLKWPGEKQ